MDRPMDGIAPGAETSLRAHLIEVEPCWLNVRCGCGSIVMVPLGMLVRQYGPDVEVGAYVARLRCKRCSQPPCSVSLQEGPNDVVSMGSKPPWSVQLIDRPAVRGEDQGQAAARPPG